ncbi:MAG TPA: divalent-cation tolerance protein CutA [Myxococcota bacterium]|nr:divalent-cation tolerance protein CutA [Myxococcota bacterium]HRY96405.1 divalent-cation tolerance protein CutA [Myxococcota bacterium]HSA23691.1 divalent-cation tolerance protein CutA [Myxococcota bacterium]
MEPRFVYITAPSAEQAERLGRALVETRLAACANVLDGVTSIYWWQGAIQREREAVLVAKTRSDLVDRLVEEVKRLHPYQVPCVVALPILAGNPDFLAWIAAETCPPAAGCR